jgi:hypothetical protein
MNMRFKNTIVLLLSGWFVLGTVCPPLSAQSEPAPAPVVTQSSEQLQQLVAPIALYPDELVAQVLAAATYPTQVVEADRWLQQHPDLEDQPLGQAVDQQAWDPSVKALVQFPSVLANMDKNLSWTSSLGEAYVNQPQQVMDAVQAMRHRAQDAGHLNSTPQQKVDAQGQTIVIEPAEPNIVYVPQYDPWLVYGAAVPIWPGWYPVPGLYLAGSGFGFGIGFPIGFFGGFGWGWRHWGFDWGHRAMVFDHHAYISHSRTFINHNTIVNRNTFVNRNAVVNHNSFSNHNTFNNRNAFANHNAIGHSGGPSAFGGFNHGGIAANHSFRGQSSFGGGFHGGFGGGGFHGGGGSHGGGRR